MDDDFFLIESLCDIEEEGGNRKESNVYASVCPMTDYGDIAFKSRYRLTKESVIELLGLIMQHLPEEKLYGRKPVPPLEQLLITLRCLAEGNYQKTTGDVHGRLQSTVSRIVKRIVAAIASLADQFIVFPDAEEAKRVARGMYEMVNERYPLSRGMPRVIGCIDGTQINIDAHGATDRENFRNRKGQISINVQAICDHQLNFTNIVVRWVGSTHDSRIFSNSNLHAEFERGKHEGWLLGDSGYPLKSYLLTPLSNPVTRSEKAYQFAHIQTRNAIERAFGVLKRRFQIIGPDGGSVRLKLKTALNATTACFVLHNFLRKRNDIFGGDDEIPFPPAPTSINSAPNSVTTLKDLRAPIIQTYFF